MAKKNELAITPAKVQSVVDVNAIQAAYKQIKLVCDEAFALKVTDMKTSDLANILAPKIKAGKKALDDLRMKITKDARDYVDTVNAMFKPLIALPKEAIDHINNERSAFAAEQRRIQAEAEKKAADEEARRQKISIAKGGTGENIKEVARPVQPKTADKVRRIPDKDKIAHVIQKAAKKLTIPTPIEIAGVSIWAEFKFEIIDYDALPDEYKKDSYTE